MLGFGAIVNICSYYVVGEYFPFQNIIETIELDVYGLGLPMGIILAFWANLGLKGLWTGLASALFCAATISIYVVYKTDWDREVSKAHERLVGDNEGPAGV